MAFRTLTTIGLSVLFLALFSSLLVLPGTEQFAWGPLYVIITPLFLMAVVVMRGELPLLSRVICVWIASMILTSNFSVSQTRSANMIILDIAYGVIFFVAFQLTTIEWTTSAVLLSALRFGSLWYVFAVAVLMINFYLTGGIGPFHPPSANMIAGMMNLLLLPTLAEFVVLQSWRRAIWIGLALTVIVVCASRGGWLGLAAGLMILIVRERAVLSPLVAKVRRFWPLAIQASAALALVGLWQLNLSNRAFTDHMPFWSLASNVFLAHPVAGTGPGTFQIWWVAAHPEAIPYTHALSLVLNTAAEQGLIGLAALTVLAVCTLRAAWPHPGLFAALVAFGFQNLVDGTHPEPAIMVTMAVLIGSTLAIGGNDGFLIPD